MYQPVILFIGLRYIRGGSACPLRRFISWLPSMGITLGVMALVTVLSVMNGFEKDLEHKILGLVPQALITGKEGSINPNTLTSFTAKSLSGVRYVTSLSTGDVVLQSARSIAIGVMLGVSPDEVDPLTPYLVNIKQHQLQASNYNIILGEQLAKNLGVKCGDLLRLIVPGVIRLTPIGRMPSERIFTVIGTFYTNTEVDGYQFLVNQNDASRLMRYPVGNITGWRLFLQKPLMVDIFSHQKLPQGSEWKDWRERKGTLFQAVHMEKNIMALLLSLIVLVAAFNIITSLGLLVMDKRSEVAILKTQGFTRVQIMTVFVIQGASAGIVGSLIGALLGVLLVTNVNNLILVFGTLIDRASLPVSVNILQVTIIVVTAIIVSLISTLYPSWRAAVIQPTEALRHE